MGRTTQGRRPMAQGSRSRPAVRRRHSDKERRDLVRQFVRSGVSDDEFLATLPPTQRVSSKTLYNWRKVFAPKSIKSRS